MVIIEMEYLGDLLVKNIHGPSGETLITDAPVDNQGKGQNFSPTDLLATSLGSCMLTTMGIVAKRDQVDLKGSKVRVEKIMVATPVRRVGQLNVFFTLPACLQVEERKKLERAALGCPVKHSLHQDVKVEVKFEYS